LNALRSVLAVVVGYVIFAVPAFAFFRISGQAPHQSAPFPVMLASIATGMLSAWLGGYAAAALGKNRPLAHGVGVAAVLSLGAAVSLLNTLGSGSIWSQASALVLMAPCAVLGGWLRSRKLAAATR
jgi:hypothetical protein